MAFGDIWQVRWVVRLGAQIGINVRHFFDETTPTLTGSAEEVAAHFAQVYGPLYKPLITTTGEYRGAGAKRIWPLPPGNEAVSTFEAGFGTVLGDNLPGQVSGLISYRTAYSGRKNRGRQFVPFPGEADNQATGFPFVQYVDRLRTLADMNKVAHTIPVAGGNLIFRPVIYNKTNPGASLTITSAIPRDRWATQRRRGNLGAGNVPPF